MKPEVVLGSDNKLKNSVLSTFSIPASVEKMNVQFIDTDTKDIYDCGWSLRVRKMEEDPKDKFELTYKKRYPVIDGLESNIESIAEGKINEVLTTAREEGFDSTTTYKAQVEVGYQKQVLSISYDKSYRERDLDGMKLPSKGASIETLTDKAPPKFKNWRSENWGIQNLAVSRIYGPVLAKRSEGTWEDMELYIEVWPIIKSKGSSDIEHVVEASFKTKHLTTALEKRNKLETLLQSKDWFLPQDSLKTSLIMERY